MGRRTYNGYQFNKIYAGEEFVVVCTENYEFNKLKYKQELNVINVQDPHEDGFRIYGINWMCDADDKYKYYMNCTIPNDVGEITSSIRGWYLQKVMITSDKKLITDYIMENKIYLENSNALSYIPIITQEICNEIYEHKLKSNNYCGLDDKFTKFFVDYKITNASTQECHKILDIDINLLVHMQNKNLDINFVENKLISKFNENKYININDMPRKYFTNNVIKNSMEKHSYILDKIEDKSFIDINSYIKMVEKGYYNTKYIPKNLFTKELCDKLINIDGNAIIYFPDEFKTDENYTKALNCQNKLNFSNIPKHMITKDLCIKNNASYHNIPKEYLEDKEFCIKTLENNLYNLKVIPMEYWDDDFMRYVLNKGAQIGDLPEIVKNKLKNTLTRNDYLIYVGKNIRNIYSVPNEILDDEMYREIFKKYPKQLHEFIHDFCFNGYLNLYESTEKMPRDVYMGLLKIGEINWVPDKYLNDRDIEEIVKLNNAMILKLLWQHHNKLNDEFIKKICKLVVEYNNEVSNQIKEQFPEYIN